LDEGLICIGSDAGVRICIDSKKITSMERARDLANSSLLKSSRRSIVYRDKSDTWVALLAQNQPRTALICATQSSKMA